MKFGRVLLVGGLVLVLLLLAGAGLVFSSSFQTWAARRALTGRPGYELTVGRVSARLGRVCLENVRLVRSGAVLTLPSAELDLPSSAAVLEMPALALGFLPPVQVRHLAARGWTLDLSRAGWPMPSLTVAAPARRQAEFSLASTAYAGDAPAPLPALFSGIFPHLGLPMDLAIDRVDLAGEVLLPALSGHPAARAKVTLTGGSLASRHPGKFDYTADLVFADPAAPVHALAIRGVLGVVMGTPRTFTRLVASTEAKATGPKFPAGVKLAVDLTAAQSAAGESYALAVLAGPKQLAAIETSYAAGESQLRGTWRIDMHDTDLLPFVLGRELPVFEAAGEGSFDVDTTFTELSASGRLKTTVDRLGAVRPGLAVLGAVQLAADFDLSQRGNTTRVDRLAVTLSRGQPIATVEALQAFEFNPRTGELNVADPAKELLGVVFQGLPLAWVNPFLRRAGFTLRGNELKGEFAASARDGGFTLRPKAPLTVTNLSVSQTDGRELLRAVDVSLQPSANYSPQGWQVGIAPLTMSCQGAPLLALELKAGRLAGPDQPVKVAGDWTIHLPALLAQPPAAGFLALTGGEAQGEFAASLGTKREIQLSLALNHLASAAPGEWPALTADLRADLDAGGKIDFNFPLVIDRAGQKSDLTLAGTLVAGPAGRVLDARLSSSSLALGDVAPYVLPLLVPAAPAGDGAGAVSRSTSAPFLAGISGACTLALQRIVYSQKIQFTDVGGTIRLEPSACRLEKLQAGFGRGSTVRLDGGLKFEAGAQPYAFTGDVGVDNFDLTEVFRAIAPDRPPTVQGRVNLQGHLAGTGSTLAELARRARGELRLSGRSGIFRALSADLSDRIQKSQSRVAAIGSFLGVVTDDYVNKSKILADIAKSLAEIPYDQLSLTAVRDDSLNLQLKEFSLISPELRLGGSGSIQYAPDVPLLAQPFELQLSLGARGRLGDLMKRAGLLESQQDGLGYAAFVVPLKLGGTVAKPDTGAIRDALLNSALERSGLLDSLFGRGKP